MSGRKRSANWLIQEKMLLLDLVTDHYSIIENKKTDGVTVKQKNAEWVKMSDEFNSQTTGVHRTAENLKAQWESLKKSTKKAASSARQSLLQTGGGPAKPQVNDPIQNKIMGLLSTSAVGLINPFDSDSVAFTIIEESSENCSSQNERALAKVPDVPSIQEPKSMVDSHILPSIPLESEKKDSISMMSQDWGDHTTEMLRTPISSSLRFQFKEDSVYFKPNEEDIGNTPQVKTSKLKARSRISKRRPTYPEICSSVMEELQKKKIQALEMQMNFAEIEREEQKKMFEIKYETQKEILKQEKLKTRLLRMQIINARGKKENNN